MTSGSRLALWIGLIAVLPSAVRGDEQANWQRLKAMPRERIATLAENLNQLDGLPRGQQAEIRDLDAKIAALPAADQAHYRAVLRRYHLWVMGLTDERRDQLKAAPPAQRMDVVTKILRAEKVSGQGRKAFPNYLRFIESGAISPTELTRVVRIWNRLSPAERAELAKLSAGEPRQKRMQQLVRQHQIRPAVPNPLTKAQEEQMIQDLEKELKANNLNLQFMKNLDLEKFKKAVQAEKAKEADFEKAAAKRRHLAESYYFAKHTPEKVRADNLLRFSASLPPWIRSPYDYLPPDEARRRLTVLYRLVYPFPEEMPKDQPAVAASKAAPSAAKTAPKAAAPAATSKSPSTGTSGSPF